MRAGVAKANITPPVGLELSGWAFGPSVGVHDDLFAKVLVLESDGERAVFITTDLIGLKTEYATAIREGVADKLDTNPGNVLVCCSHTHSGPATMFLRRWGEIDENYVRVVEKQIIGAATLAALDMEKARIGAGRGNVEGVGINRRERENGSVDSDVGVIRIDNGKGRMMAVMMNFSCHPVAAHNFGNLISADYPGYAMGVLEKAKGNGFIALHTTGAAGDINPIELHDIVWAEKYGNMVGGEALKVAEAVETGPELRLSVASEFVNLPVRKLPAAEELRAMIAAGNKNLEKLKRRARAPHAQLMGAYQPVEWAQDALAAIETGTAVDHLEMEIQVVRMSDAALVAMPGEIFVDIGLNIKRASPFPHTFIVAMANGVIAYLPTRKAFIEKGYEPEEAAKLYGTYLLTPDIQDIIEEGAARALKRT